MACAGVSNGENRRLGETKTTKSEIKTDWTDRQYKTQRASRPDQTEKKRQKETARNTAESDQRDKCVYVMRVIGSQQKGTTKTIQTRQNDGLRQSREKGRKTLNVSMCVGCAKRI